VPVGARTLGPGRQIVSQDNPNGVSRFGGQAGTEETLTLRPFQDKTGEAGPEAQSTVSLHDSARTILSARSALK
jgi:hypothetical protein